MRRAKIAIIRQLRHITVGFTASRDDFAGGYCRMFAVVFLRYAEHLVKVFTNEFHTPYMLHFYFLPISARNAIFAAPFGPELADSFNVWSTFLFRNSPKNTAFPSALLATIVQSARSKGHSSQNKLSYYGKENRFF